jgi:hypothetical protein
MYRSGIRTTVVALMPHRSERPAQFHPENAWRNGRNGSEMRFNVRCPQRALAAVRAPIAARRRITRRCGG